MRLKRWMTGLGAGVLCATAAFVAPGLQAQGRGDAARSPVSVRSGIGTFTPASADPKLAAMLARSGLPDSGFRFTPSESRRGAGNAVTVAVRARTTRGNQVNSTQAAVATTPSLSLAPAAYNLGVSVGWKRFAVSGDLAKVEGQAALLDRDDLPRFNLVPASWQAARNLCANTATKGAPASPSPHAHRRRQR